MPIRSKISTRTALLAATLLAGTAFVIVPSALSPVIAEEDHRADDSQARAERSAEDAEHEDHRSHDPQAQAEAPAKDAEPKGHGGMTGGGMQMQGGMPEGGMQGCKMMGGEHAGKMDTKPGMMPGEMHKTMHAMMAEMAARVDERLAAARSDLAITEAQLPLWTAFADAVRRAARSMEQTHKEMMAAEAAAAMPMPRPAAAPAPEPTPGGDKSYPGMEAVKKIEPAAPPSEKPAGSLPAKLDAHEKMLTRRLDNLKGIAAALDPLYATFDAKQKAVADNLKIGPMGVM